MIDTTPTSTAAMTPRPLILTARPLKVRQYGCVKCQATHTEGDELYEPHLLFQSKHGTRWVVKPDCYVAEFPATGKQ